MYKKITFFLLVIINLVILQKSDFIEIAGGKRVLPDFDNYYLLTQEAKRGVNPYTVSHMITPAPPIVFAYYYPYTYLPLENARTVSTILNLLSGFLLCYILAKKYFPRSIIIFSLIFSAVYFSSFPTRFALILGQPLLLATLLITLILISGSVYKKSLYLSFLISLKSFFVFSLLSYLKKNKSVVFITLAVLILFSIISFVFVNTAVQNFYVQNIFSEYLLDKTLPQGTDYYSQSFKSTVNRLFLGRIYFPLYVLFVFYAVYKAVKKPDFLKSVLLAIMISPVVWQHYFTLIFPVIVNTIIKIKINPKSLPFIILAIFFWWIEFPWMHYSNLNIFTRLLASHYFLSAVVFLKLSDYSSSSA